MKAANSDGQLVICEVITGPEDVQDLTSFTVQLHRVLEIHKYGLQVQQISDDIFRYSSLFTMALPGLLSFGPAET